MNNNNKVVALIQHLESEITWIEQLNSLLEQEKLMLTSRQFLQLEALSNQKQQLSAQLEQSAQNRIHLITQENTTTLPAQALSDFLKQCSTEETNTITALNHKLAAELTRCRTLNTVNGQVIVSNIYIRQQIVNILSGNKSEALSVYTSNGDLKSAKDNRHYEEA